MTCDAQTDNYDNLYKCVPKQWLNNNVQTFLNIKGMYSGVGRDKN